MTNDRSIEQLRGEISRFIRIGEVVAVYAERATVRVQFPELSEGQTYELPVVVPFAAEDHAYFLPDRGDIAVCLFLPHAPSRGFVLGAIYTKRKAVPFSEDETPTEAKRRIQFKDGTTIEYDRDASVLTLSFKDGSIITYDAEASSLAFEIEGTLDVVTDKTTRHTSLDQLYIHAKGFLRISSDSKVLITAPLVELSGTEVRVTAAAFNVDAVSTFVGAVSITGAVAVTGTLTTTGGGIDAEGPITAESVTATGSLSVASAACTSLTIGGLPVVNVNGFWKTG